MLKADTSYLTTLLLAATSKCEKGSVLVSACRCLRDTFLSSDLYQKVMLPARRNLNTAPSLHPEEKKGHPEPRQQIINILL